MYIPVWYLYIHVHLVWYLIFIHNTFLYTLYNVHSCMVSIHTWYLYIHLHLVWYLILIHNTFLYTVYILHLEKRLDFGEQSPPLPVPKTQVAFTISLQHLYSFLLLDEFLVVFPGQVTASHRLKPDNQNTKLLVTLWFQVSQYSRSKEDLGLANTIQTGI